MIFHKNSFMKDPYYLRKIRKILAKFVSSVAVVLIYIAFQNTHQIM